MTALVPFAYSERQRRYIGLFPSEEAETEKHPAKHMSLLPRIQQQRDCKHPADAAEVFFQVLPILVFFSFLSSLCGDMRIMCH